MKTITLTDDAYERLLALKSGPKDSFSKVIMSTVPKRGTAAQMLAAVKKLPPLTDKQARLMDQVVKDGNDWKNWRDPWTTS